MGPTFVADASLTARLSFGYVYSLVVAAYTYLTVRRAPPGVQRVALALPVLISGVFISSLVVHFDEAILIIPVAGIFHLMVFKVRIGTSLHCP